MSGNRGWTCLTAEDREQFEAKAARRGFPPEVYAETLEGAGTMINLAVCSFGRTIRDEVLRLWDEVTS